MTYSVALMEAGASGGTCSSDVLDTSVSGGTCCSDVQSSFERVGRNKFPKGLPLSGGGHISVQYMSITGRSFAN